jgi:glutamate synthase domain-containing protein 2
MIGKYHIETTPAPLSSPYPAKFRLGEEDEYVKYGHGALNPGRRGSDPFWTPQVITQIWYQAETGKIPISGGGYGGAFAGEGFDGLWLDMSEIVRPTRDGIHGREYISTAIDLGRKAPMLKFDASGQLALPPPPLLEIPLPILFNPLPLPTPGRGAKLAVAKAAACLGIFTFVEADDWDDDLLPYADYIAPRLSNLQGRPPSVPPNFGREVLCSNFQLVELDYGEETILLWERIKVLRPEAVVSLRLPLAPRVEREVESLVGAGAEVIHLYADDYGYELNGGSHPRHLTEALRAVHGHLVELGLRDEVTLLVSGGIAAAEHVPKAIACGADGVAVDFSLLVALGCALWADERHPCPAEGVEVDPDWGAQRIVNLMAAWRDQLLEVLGAMGMRDVRRLRGETGRAIFYPEEEERFRSLFLLRRKEPSVAQLPPDFPEGDLRWTPELLQATHIQAETGRLPELDIEARVGCSGGGFDCLRFAFEHEGDQVPFEEDEELDLSLELNRRGEGPRLRIPLPFYGAGMSFGSISLNTMLARAKAAKTLGIFVCTGEGGYPDELVPYADYIITQVATGLFGVREETIQRTPIVEFKYAQGAKPGLGGHLLASKVTLAVAHMREAVAGRSLYSPFPFHSVYSVEDHKKHVDWIKAVNPRALVSVKVSTPTDVDMVAVGIYYAGAHIIHLDGAYGGTGAAPEVSKKNIAMPIEYAIPKVHRFLTEEGIRDEIVLMASGGIRTAYDVAKAIALGADGAVIGTAELVALGCTRLGTCEKDKGCPFGITTTDPELSALIDPDEGARRIVNMVRSWRAQLAGILKTLGLKSIGDLRGRTDLLVYLEE